MTIDFNQKKLEAIRSEAGLTEIVFPACCLSCDNNVEDFCKKLEIPIDNPFQICKYYSE